jgi:glycosyltransferase 2 family protein
MRAGLRTWIVRLLLSAVVLTAVVAVLPREDLWAAMRAVPPGRWLLVLLGFLLGHVVTAFKWRVLMGGGQRIPPRLWLRAHFSGLIANLWLPTVAGGDVVRAALVMRHVESPQRVAVASVVDRVIDTGALLILAVTGLLWSHTAWTLARPVLIGVAAVAAVGTAVAIPLLFWLRKRHATAGLPGRLAQAVVAMSREPLRPAAALVMSVLMQGNFILLSSWLGDAAGVRAPFAAWLVAWPLAKLTALLPVSLGGLGVREAALVVFMRPFGAAPAAVLAAGILWQGVLVTSGLVGWVVLHLYPDDVAVATEPVSAP